MSKKSKKKVVVTTENEKKSTAKKKTVTTKTVKKKIAPTTSRGSSRGSTATIKSEEMIFGRTNYILMIAGALLIGLGLICMIGGWMPDDNTWDPNIIYSTRITVIAPLLILAGLITEIFAIFKK